MNVRKTIATLVSALLIGTNGSFNMSDGTTEIKDDYIVSLRYERVDLL